MTYKLRLNARSPSDGASRDLTITLVEAQGVLKGKVTKAAEIELSSKPNELTYKGNAEMKNSKGKKVIEAQIQLKLNAGVPKVLFLKNSKLDQSSAGLRIVLDECKELKN